VDRTGPKRGFGLRDKLCRQRGNPLSVSSDVIKKTTRWTDAVFRERPRSAAGLFTVGVLPGEGIGPEVISAALEVLSAVASSGGARFETRTGGAIGREAEVASGRPLSEEVAAFCAEVFERGGAVLAGPGGGRFVYDLRRRFDLFCKLSPLRPIAPLLDAGRLKAHGVAGADILLVRENMGGVYQGQWRETVDDREGRLCEHSFRYSERQVRRLLEVATRLATGRRGRLSVVIKDSGVPGMSALWRDLGRDVGSSAQVEVRFVDIDLAAYLLMQDPLSFDVIAAPNLFGDVLADLGAVLLSSRGLSYSGNFSEEGAAVYQTNHGSALDLAGQGRANPLGQIASLAMMLRESFGLAREAGWIDSSIEEVMHQGFRTFDVAEPGTTVVGTAEMGGHIASAVRGLARRAE
jgi:3-isopropylmalate dehydrogenase